MSRIMHRSLCAGILAFGFVAASAARAQTPVIIPQAARPAAEPWVRIGFGGGMSVPVHDAQTSLKTGVNGKGFLLVRLPRGLPPLRFTFDYQKFNLRPTAGSGTDGTHESLGGLGGLSIDLFRGPVRPYITAGLGAFNIRNVLTMASGGTQASTGTNWGVDGGGGLAIRLGRLSAFAEGHVQNVYSQRGVIDRKSIQTIPVTFGLMY